MPYLYDSREPPLNNSHRVIEVHKSSGFHINNSSGRVIDLDNYTVSKQESPAVADKPARPESMPNKIAPTRKLYSRVF